MVHETDQGQGPPRRAAAAARPRRVLIGALGATSVLVAFVALAGVAASRQASDAPVARVAPNAPGAPVDAATAQAGGLSLVVRTAQHLQGTADVVPLVKRLVADDVERVWVQVKQDENEEYRSGTLLYPSRIGPVAAGHQDDRLGAFVDDLDANGVEAMAWMPVLHDAQAAREHPDWRSRTITEGGRLEVQQDWLCPFNPQVQRYQASIAREVATTMPKLGGLYLDFIRYDDEYSCASADSLAELEDRTDWRERTGRRLTPMDLRRAGDVQNALWTAWNDLRAEKIADTVETIRDAVADVRPDFRIGAFTLPFSSRSYEDHTESGQDLTLMSQAGLDEIVLMGYWDDWEKDPAWVRRGLDGAERLIGADTDLSVVLDGDMGVRRTRLTLEALGPWAKKTSWFHFGTWAEGEFRRLDRAIEGHLEGPMPKPDYVSVVIRIDTEPDFRPSYRTVHPEMIDQLLDLFAAEDVKATFMTVGKLAELQTAAIDRVEAAGHEIGSHAYDHEQLDSLPLDRQLEAVDKGLASLDRLGYPVHGFGAPRNSITDETRDRLMDWGLEYDGSAAYDPLTSLLDVHYAPQSEGLDNRILVVPFVIPNDWDARYIDTMSADEMVDAWSRRLDKVVESGEPVFVLDIHQWSITEPDNLEALREFIDYAQSCDECRVETLRDAAQHARTILDTYELPHTTSGDQS